MAAKNEIFPSHMMDNMEKWLRNAEAIFADAQSAKGRFKTFSPMTKGQVVDPLRMARQLIALYRRRNELFAQLGANEVFGDPAWNMLIDLFIETKASRRVSVSSLCIGSMAPQTTALRHIALLVQRGVLIRTPDEEDSRRIFVSFSPPALQAMERLFADHGMWTPPSTAD